MKALRSFNSPLSNNNESPSLRLGHVRVDHSHVDCALLLHRYPGGCLLEIDHRSEMTVCFVEDLKDVVILAFDHDMEEHRVVETNALPKSDLFIGFDEPYLLVLPELFYRTVEAQFNALNSASEEEGADGATTV